MISISGREELVRNKLHFREIDWIIFIPDHGNEGRELRNYGVAYRDRVHRITQPGPKINLGDVLSQASISNGYPHTVGLYQRSDGRGDNWVPQYIATSVIHNEEELLQWIAQIEGL